MSTSVAHNDTRVRRDRLSPAHLERVHALALRVQVVHEMHGCRCAARAAPELTTRQRTCCVSPVRGCACLGTLTLGKRPLMVQPVHGLASNARAVALLRVCVHGQQQRRGSVAHRPQHSHLRLWCRQVSPFRHEPPEDCAIPCSQVHTPLRGVLGVTHVQLAPTEHSLGGPCADSVVSVKRRVASLRNAPGSRAAATLCSVLPATLPVMLGDTAA